MDENGNFATDVDVWFILNDLTISVKYVDALFYNGSTEFDFYNGPLEVTAEFVAVDFGSNNITVRIDEFSFDTDSAWFMLMSLNPARVLSFVAGHALLCDSCHRCIFDIY